ncbi:MAG: RHS repeat-associated core domain-containing protein, partial [Gammaproteobacteria bacterium]|nr:RHS repeat-associated core domain-containing protein [Gammaproteobacteria bacterium]
AGTDHLGYGYTGEQFDADTGLLYLRARYYDPMLGRFISVDPYLGRLEVPESQNRVIYVHNNPLLYTDPSGLAVYQGQHGAFASGQTTFNHQALVFIPDDPSYFVGYAQFRQDPLSGTKYFTAGGQPSGYPANWGTLQIELNYPGDSPVNLNQMVKVPTPVGVSDTDHILAYMSAFEAFSNNTLIYSPTPSSGSDRYNSNGFVTGAMSAVGDSPFNLPGFSPGESNPIPLPFVRLRNDASTMCY